MKITLEHDNKTVQAEAQWIRGVLWMNYKGHTWSYQPQLEKEKMKSRSGGASSASGGMIKSPMPGKIIRILKQQDEAVKNNDALIVMEAMKMEYTLKADCDGVIKKLNCKTGDQVTLGAVLVQIQKDGV